MKYSICVIAAVLVLTTANSAFSHHSFPAHYDDTKKVSIDGQVREFRFENPHSRIYVLVTGDDGETVEWLVEMDSRNGFVFVCPS